MTGIDGGIAATLQDRPPAQDSPLPDVWTSLDTEFVVEWQVAAGASVAPQGGTGEVSSL